MKKLITLFLLTFGIANAQTHTFKFILSSGPGSGSDVSIETYAPCLKKQNISVLKEYKPGAEGLVAIKAPPAVHEDPSYSSVQDTVA